MKKARLQRKRSTIPIRVQQWGRDQPEFPKDKKTPRVIITKQRPPPLRDQIVQLEVAHSQRRHDCKSVVFSLIFLEIPSIGKLLRRDSYITRLTSSHRSTNKAN